MHIIITMHLYIQKKIFNVNLISSNFLRYSCLETFLKDENYYQKQKRVRKHNMLFIKKSHWIQQSYAQLLKISLQQTDVFHLKMIHPSL